MKNIIGGTKTGIFTIAALLMLSLCAVTYAGQGHGPGMRPPGPEGRGFGPPAEHLLDKAIHENMAAEALAELTGKTLEVIKAELAASHMGAVLESNNIDQDTFKTLMNTKMSAAAQKAADCGLITADQATEIIAKIASSASDTSDTTEDSDDSTEETESETAADTISETVQSAY